MGEHQFMQGFTITVGLMALAKATSPLLVHVDYLLQLEYVAVVVWITVSYGIYLMVTAPESVELMEKMRRYLSSDPTTTTSR